MYHHFDDKEWTAWLNTDQCCQIKITYEKYGACFIGTYTLYANRQENDTHLNSSEWWGLNSSGSPQLSISPKAESDSTTTKI